jgi:hypothetical protein
VVDVLSLRQIKSGANTFFNITEMQKEIDKMHEELLELISNLSDGTNSNREPSVSIDPSYSKLYQSFLSDVSVVQ